MGETETLSNLQMLIDALRPSPAPVERQLWDSMDVARYLGLSREYIMSNIARRDGFPNQIRIAGGRPLWKAIEVTAWASAYTAEKKAIETELPLHNIALHPAKGKIAKRRRLKMAKLVVVDRWISRYFEPGSEPPADKLLVPTNLQVLAGWYSLTGQNRDKLGQQGNGGLFPVQFEKAYFLKLGTVY